ncbi:MAG: Cof-type HAD-IIB family hydrolase [Psychromonas sp.]
MYKIAISDLDGTLLGADHKLSIQTKKSIHNWIESGRKFVIATGRHYIEAKSLQEQLGEPIYLITSNGARVHDKKGKIIIKQNLLKTIATEICNIEFDASVQINLFTDQHWYANIRLPEVEGMGLVQAFNCQVTDIKTLDKNNIIKIFFWAEPEPLKIIYEQLKARFNDDVNLTFSLSTCLEVMNKNTNKGSAVAAVLKEKGISCAQAIAFGDAMNDVEMLRLVGKPMVMANAQVDLCRALPEAERALSAEEHGVSKKLEQLLIPKELKR